jgi:hypothetical protein
MSRVRLPWFWKDTSLLSLTLLGKIEVIPALHRGREGYTLGTPWPPAGTVWFEKLQDAIDLAEEQTTSRFVSRHKGTFQFPLKSRG